MKAKREFEGQPATLAIKSRELSQQASWTPLRKDKKKKASVMVSSLKEVNAIITYKINDAMFLSKAS